MATDSTQSITGLLGSSTTTQTSTSSTSSSSTADAFDMNSFLTLFLTQLKCQDPTNPMQSYELASQLAQFSTVAKLTEATTALDNLESYASAINNADMASLVGKTVSAAKSTIDVSSGSASDLSYQLSSAGDVTITIKDSDGNTVYTETKSSQSAGSYNVGWNGKNQSGDTVSDGSYTCEVQSVDSSGSSSTLTTSVQGQVYACNLNATSPYFILSDGTKVAAADVVVVATQ